jgi:endogenous inhibitor of DNA gyrase (YacG/DUF329 family)
MERICPHCGEPLSEDAHPLRVYCSKRCGKKDARKRSRERKRTAGNKGRTCAECEAPLGPGARPTREYCSVFCAKRAERRRRRERQLLLVDDSRGVRQLLIGPLPRRNPFRAKGPCTHCRRPLPNDGSNRHKFCSRKCARAHLCLLLAARYARDPEFRERNKAAARRHRRKNPEARTRLYLRGIKKRMRGGKIFRFTDMDWQRVVNRFKHCCAYCGERVEGTLHKEHVIPLSRGGDHGVGNIVPACSACNHSKYGSTVSEWRMRQIRLSRVFGAKDGVAS